MKKRNLMISVDDTPTLKVEVVTKDYLDTLKDSLWVWWELQPASRMWKAELVQTGVTTFVYAGEEPALVRWVGDLAYTVEW